MYTEGRVEKRAAVKIPVHIAPVESGAFAETTTTINVSRQGACVLTVRPWGPGERLSLASLSGDLQRQAKVVYCHSQADGRFCIGLEFDANLKGWKDTAWADAAQI
ncbi:MAG TPA: PilZ domain-containing protein [Candidatus Acidoferrum sp.]|nr:PilZ domain-containing protein [Candidatus Acidoferrum sp.]